MARRPNRRQYGPKKASGPQIAANRIRVYICDKCGHWNEGKKPEFFCESPGKCDGTTFTHFDSRAEAQRWAELLLLQRSGQIAELRRQQRLALMAPYDDEDKIVGHYVADFTYVEDGKQIIEDVKGGAMTDLAAWKMKHVEAQYGTKVRIVQR